MIDWHDRSDANGERHTCELGAIDLDLARELSPTAVSWMLILRWRLARSHEQTSRTIEPCDAERARALALVAARPLVDALAARAADVARDVAVAIADARLEERV